MAGKHLKETAPSRLIPSDLTVEYAPGSGRIIWWSIALLLPLATIANYYGW